MVGSNYLQQHVSVSGFGAPPRLRLGDDAREFAVDAGCCDLDLGGDGE